MKTVIIRGGLGNQLFGLAFADTVAQVSGRPVRLDLSSYNHDPHGRVFETADLAAEYGLDMSAEIPPPRPRLMQRLFSKPPVRIRIVEPRPPFDEGTIDTIVRTGDVFDGYWQNARWFDRPDVVRERTRVFLERLGDGALRHDVVIHHRIYHEERLPGRMRGPGPQYFENALRQLEQWYGPLHDIAAISNRRGIREEAYGAFDDRVTRYVGSPASDMALMLNARYLVLTNSSFSWWGGYCGDAERVIYPSRGKYFHYPIPSRRFHIIE